LTLRKLAPPVDPALVRGLEEIVSHAKSGNLRGAVCLLNFPQNYAHWQGGLVSFETAVTALEAWKWHQFSKRFPR
jgi:hypothetical protein